jgi:hypothetical protein
VRRVDVDRNRIWVTAYAYDLRRSAIPGLDDYFVEIECSKMAGEFLLRDRDRDDMTVTPNQALERTTDRMKRS